MLGCVRRLVELGNNVTDTAKDAVDALHSALPVALADSIGVDVEDTVPKEAKQDTRLVLAACEHMSSLLVGDVEEHNPDDTDMVASPARRTPCETVRHTSLQYHSPGDSTVHTCSQNRPFDQKNRHRRHQNLEI